jgi:hypothetical protein
MGTTKPFKKIYLAGVFKKGRLESSCMKREQAYCTQHRNSKNRLYL